MTPTPKSEIAAAYSAAADHYDALTFWNYFGQRTVARVAPQPGDMVLDVCCGAGASALPAARAVTPGGRVIGVDLAPPLLALARAKAAAQSIVNVEFRHADFDQVYFRPHSFQSVVCVFGLFFFPEMAASLRKMWRLVRPGGTLAVTTWGPHSFEPGHSLFWNAIRRERPDLDQAHSARQQLSEPGAVERVFAAAGIPNVQTEAEDHEHPLQSPADFWAIVMGTSYRGRIDQLTGDQRARVRQACLALDSPTLRMPVVYTRAVA